MFNAEARMTDTSQGPGWWQASDGKWYPPEQASASPVAPPVADSPPGPGFWKGTDGQWYPPQVPPAQPVKKPVYKRVWFWLLVVLALGIGACVSIINLAGNAINTANNKTHTVVYSVTGSGSVSLSYAAIDKNQGGMTQNSDVPLPWTKTITGSGLFNYYSVTATLGAGGGSATCTITVDGKVVTTNSATGVYSSASCSGHAS